MKKLLFLLLLPSIIFLSPAGLAAQAQSPFVMKLWPEKANPKHVAEKELPSRGDDVIRITDIYEPSLTVFPVNNSIEPVPAVLIFPGGGYSYLAFNKEGTDVAEWFNSIGITAVVVKYRVPDKRKAAFQDAQRAMRLVHHHAEEWNIDPDRIGVIGFSAGGHLAARLSTDFKNNTYTPTDNADQEICRPDFSILIYPAYLINKDKNELAAELPVSSDVPPTFIVQTEDDINYVSGTILYDRDLKKAGGSSSFHLFPEGGHGYGLVSPSEYAVSTWPELCEKWLNKNDILPPASIK